MFRLREMGYVLAFVALMLALYVGGYYATVSPEQDMTRGYPTLSGGTWPPTTAKQPTYAVAPDLLEWLFRPMHALDRRMRPDVWE